jgi:hypothetical protein
MEESAKPLTISESYTAKPELRSNFSEGKNKDP